MNPHDAKVIRDGLDKFLDEANTFCQIVSEYENTQWNPEVMLIGNSLGDILTEVYALRQNLEALIPDHIR